MCKLAKRCQMNDFVPGQTRGISAQVRGARGWLHLLLLAAVLIAPSALQGQVYTGSVTGVVTDPSGGVIPSAKITLVDQDKGYTFTATTDTTGRYLLRSISPGNYTITAEATNFQCQRRDNIRVDVSQNIS